MLSTSIVLASIVTLQVEIQAWTRSCKLLAPMSSLSCSLPVALGDTIRTSAHVQLAGEPSEARLSKMPFSHATFSGEVRFYSTYPLPDSGRPQFIQIQIEGFSPLRSLCLQSVRLRRPFEASPISCTGYDAASGEQVGINVKVSELSASPATSSK